MCNFITIQVTRCIQELNPLIRINPLLRIIQPGYITCKTNKISERHNLNLLEQSPSRCRKAVLKFISSKLLAKIFIPLRMGYKKCSYALCHLQVSLAKVISPPLKLVLYSPEATKI